VNTYNDVDYCVNQYNSRSDNAVLHKDFSYYENGQYLGTAEPSGDLYSGQLVINLPKALQYPTFIMRVKAQWLGVELTCGRPQITQIDPVVTVENGRQEFLTRQIESIVV